MLPVEMKANVRYPYSEPHLLTCKNICWKGIGWPPQIWQMVIFIFQYYLATWDTAGSSLLADYYSEECVSLFLCIDLPECNRSAMRESRNTSTCHDPLWNSAYAVNIFQFLTHMPVAVCMHVCCLSQPLAPRLWRTTHTNTDMQEFHH